LLLKLGMISIASVYIYPLFNPNLSLYLLGFTDSIAVSTSSTHSAGQKPRISRNKFIMAIYKIYITWISSLKYI